MKTLTVTWTGIRPLVMHNGDMADHRNPYAKEIKKITEKRKGITDDDRDFRDKLEWLGGLYFHGYGKVMKPEGKAEIFVPSDAIEACIKEGAQKKRQGKNIQAAVWCAEPEAMLEFEGPKDLAKLADDPGFILRKGVKVTTSRIIRVRPMFAPGWRLTFDLQYDESVITNAESLIDSMNTAGLLVGLGDWRPKFGRFTVETA